MPLGLVLYLLIGITALCFGALIADHLIQSKAKPRAH